MELTGSVLSVRLASLEGDCWPSHIAPFAVELCRLAGDGLTWLQSCGAACGWLLATFAHTRTAGSVHDGTLRCSTFPRVLPQLGVRVILCSSDQFSAFAHTAESVHNIE